MAEGGRGGVAKYDMMTRGRGGVWLPPENDDVIYEQPLISILFESVSVRGVFWQFPKSQ